MQWHFLHFSFFPVSFHCAKDAGDFFIHWSTVNVSLLFMDYCFTASAFLDARWLNGKEIGPALHHWYLFPSSINDVRPYVYLLGIDGY